MTTANTFARRRELRLRLCHRMDAILKRMREVSHDAAPACDPGALRPYPAEFRLSAAAAR